MYTVKNSFEFTKEIADQDPGLFMVSLDVESLFTNIPLEETISMCCDFLFSNDAKGDNINRIDFEKLLRAALQNKFFNFEGKIYKQILLWQRYFYVSMNIFALMNVLMNSNLYNTEDMFMTYLFCFVHLFILRNSKIV